MNVPAWRLEWLAALLRSHGARRVPDTRADQRRLHAAYILAMFGRKRRLRKAIERAGAHGTLAAQLGGQHRE